MNDLKLENQNFLDRSVFHEIGNNNSMEEFISLPGIKVVLISASFLQPGRRQYEIVSDIITDIDGKASFAYVDLDLVPDIPIFFNLNSFPSTLLIGNEGTVLEVIQGVCSPNELIDKITRLI